MQLDLLSTHLYKTIKTKPVQFIYIPLVVYWLILFIATSIPIERFPYFFKAQDKLEHFIAYFLLAILLFLTFHLQKRKISISKNATLYSMVAVIIYAGFDEVHQLIIPGRYCDIFDFVSDVVGGIIGIILTKLFFRKEIATNLAS
jgi:VanZ family protein